MAIRCKCSSLIFSERSVAPCGMCRAVAGLAFDEVVHGQLLCNAWSVVVLLIGFFLAVRRSQSLGQNLCQLPKQFLPLD